MCASVTPVPEFGSSVPMYTLAAWWRHSNKGGLAVSQGRSDGLDLVGWILGLAGLVPRCL